ncbi:MAG: hypothetical protein BRD55_01425 [Bacteroidetes bacterium SW_9_63_38]|nr:MAG: hypothetical protein BRD55_01425 [Bacteroidetes bacterium SW_9_63_38]
MLLLIGAGDQAAYGQTDTTATPPDTVAADSSKKGTASLPSSPQTLPSLGRGRPIVDSRPAITPHTGVEHVIAQQPGSFLYDLGAVGWPHGWSPAGLGPHRSRLWINGHPYNSPLTGRARFDLLPPSFLQSPRVGTDPGGAAVGVHTAWRAYDQRRPITELRFRRDSNGQSAIEVGHSQKHRLSVFGAPGVLQASIGYGGRATEGFYVGDDLRRERRLWGRVRYQRADWAVEITDLASRRRIGAHSGVVPPEGQPFSTIYRLPFCESCSQNANASRRTFRNDLTIRLRAPLVPGLDAPTDVSVTWTSNTFDFDPGGSPSSAASGPDTTWSVVMNGGHGRVQQSLRLGTHALTLGAQGSLWQVERSNVASVDGRRWSAHVFARDSLALGRHRLTLDAGWHTTSDHMYPSAAVEWARPTGAVEWSASLSMSGQRRSWFSADGFPGFVRPLSDESTVSAGGVLRAGAGMAYQAEPFDVSVKGFAHQIREAADLFAPPLPLGSRVASADSVIARRTSTPVRRIGATISGGWRRSAARGLYATGTGTVLRTLNADASTLHTRLADTLPTLHGRGRIGVRFVVFQDLTTDLYLQARGWTQMSSRWFHPPTGRLVVPPATNVVPTLGPQFRPGPNGTLDVHAEIELRGATLFFAVENVQSSFAPAGSSEQQATLTPGTYVVPVYPLPARQFRFGVHWPIFD